MKIAVGSTNPVKVAAVKDALADLIPDLEVQGFEVSSGVADQPFSEEETRQGTLNRAQRALNLAMSSGLNSSSDFDLGVGLEGGVAEQVDGLYSTVWVCLVSADGRQQFVNSNRFILPDQIANSIRAGQEMGAVMDNFTGRTNLKHQEGMIGILTGGIITRKQAYAQMIKMAYGLWKNQIGR